MAFDIRIQSGCPAGWETAALPAAPERAREASGRSVGEVIPECLGGRLRCE